MISNVHLDMGKSKLIHFCKYYKGESECPKSIEKAGKPQVWFYESCWVNNGGKYDDNGEYEYADLMDFAKDDDTPLSLKKLLFNRYSKGCWSIATAVPGFKVYYHEFYRTLNTDLKKYYQDLEIVE